VAAAPLESKIRGYKEKMFKGAEQRLKTTLQGQARSAAQKVFSKAAGEARRQAGEAISESFTSEEAVPENPVKGVSGWIWIFLLLSILLALLSGVSGDLAFVVTGILAYGIGRVLILSAVILLLVLARKNKPKPMNWLAKILLLGQILLLTWILYNRIMGQYFDLSALAMAALFLTDLKLLFNGNK
jgi:hypothetical protein